MEQLEEALISRQEALDGRESRLNADMDAHLVRKRNALKEEFSQKAKDIWAQDHNPFAQKIKA